MSSVSHEPSRAAYEGPRWSSLWRLREVWVSLAITAMWIAVFVTALWGPDARFNSNDGTSSTIPSGVFVALFAFLGTWTLAKYALRQQQEK
jgi:hypothetical protein